MSTSSKIMTSKLVARLIEAGYIDNFIDFNGAKVDLTIDWELMDRPSRANVLASLIQTAYAAVANAAWREHLGEKPLNTACDDFPYEGEEYPGSEPRMIQTLEEAIDSASEVRTMVRSYASDNSWLNGWSQRSFRRDAKGQLITDENGGRIMDEVLVNSFSQDIYDWSIMDSDDPLWADKLLQVRAANIHVGWAHEGIDACNVNFLEWANDVPWSPDSDPRTRLERAVHKIGNKKWGETKLKLMQGTPLKGNEFKHWGLMALSPQFQHDAKAVATSTSYRLYKMEMDVEKAETLQAECELKTMEDNMRALLQARMDKLLGVVAPAPTPPAEKARIEAELAKAQPKSRAPRTINNKGAAGGKFATH